VVFQKILERHHVVWEQERPIAVLLVLESHRGKPAKMNEPRRVASGLLEPGADGPGGSSFRHRISTSASGSTRDCPSGQSREPLMRAARSRPQKFFHFRGPFDERHLPQRDLARPGPSGLLRLPEPMQPRGVNPGAFGRFGAVDGFVRIVERVNREDVGSRGHESEPFKEEGIANYKLTGKCWSPAFRLPSFGKADSNAPQQVYTCLFYLL